MRLLATVFLCLVVQYCVGDVFQVPVKRIESPKNRLKRLGLWEEEFKRIEERRLAKGLKTGQHVNDYQDIEYIGQIQIGTPQRLPTLPGARRPRFGPRQQFNVLLDTGSANLWVPTVGCGNANYVPCADNCTTFGQDACTQNCDLRCCGVKSGCLGKNAFDPQESPTFVSTEKTWSIQYGSGAAAGVFGRDTVYFLGTAGSDPVLAVNDTTFGLATFTSPEFTDPNFDGILGLALQDTATGNVPPPLWQAWQNGLLAKPEFTVYLAKAGPGQNITSSSITVPPAGGVYTYGGVDIVNCGRFMRFQPLVYPQWYSFMVDGVKVNGANAFSVQGPWMAISDTGTSLIGGPKAIVDNIANAMGAIESVEYQEYIIDCNAAATMPTLTYTIGDIDYAIDASELVVRTGPVKNQCQLAFFPQDFGGNGPAWILGDPWIRMYCQLYDMENRRISFAPSITPAPAAPHYRRGM